MRAGQRRTTTYYTGHLHFSQGNSGFALCGSFGCAKLLKGMWFGRGDRIRTCDPLRPRQVRYQAALRPDYTDCSSGRSFSSRTRSSISILPRPTRRRSFSDVGREEHAGQACLGTTLVFSSEFRYTRIRTILKPPLFSTDVNRTLSIAQKGVHVNCQAIQTAKINSCSSQRGRSSQSGHTSGWSDYQGRLRPKKRCARNRDLAREH